MRSQGSKPLSTKKVVVRRLSTFKTSSIKKPAKKRVTSKKVKKLPKSIKNPKRNTAKDEISNQKDEDNSADDKTNTSSETAKPGPSKPISTRSDSPTKKCKKELKEKKDTTKVVTTVVSAKKTVKAVRNTKSATKMKQDIKDSDIKYKINLDTVKKNGAKFCKAKSNIKKVMVSQKKKVSVLKQEDTVKEEQHKEERSDTSALNNVKDQQISSENKQETIVESKFKAASEQSEDSLKSENKKALDTPLLNNSTSSHSYKLDTPKHESERPPKFFTSSRPRTVDVDIKFLKNSKGNLSVSERFLPMKCETKNYDNKDKINSSDLLSQESEIDVYTFTEKVDSPKNILSDFGNPIKIGRVRPVARVKGTIVDKKTEGDKKKYPPHRPIEEVVQQLKANKRSEQLNQNPASASASSGEGPSIRSADNDMVEPTPIVSKSYKMVARKSSITGKPFSPIKFFDQESSASKPEETSKKTVIAKKKPVKAKKQQKKCTLSDEDIDTSKFSLNTTAIQYTSSDESVGESNDDNDSKDSSESDTPKVKKIKNKKYKKITDGAKKTTSKELKELSKDSLIDLKDNGMLLGNEKPSKRRLKLLSMWAGPKKHRIASLNALAKVHCLYENESRTHLELGLMKTIDRPVMPSTSKTVQTKKKESKSKDSDKQESTSESEYEAKKEQNKESSESSDDSPPKRTLRGVVRSAGKYWDPKSSSSSEESELETKGKSTEKKKVVTKTTVTKSDSDKPPSKVKKVTGVTAPKKKRNRNEVVMDLKDMVVQKRMASLNATAILAASYEKRSPKSNKDDTTSDSCSDESFIQKPKNVISSGVKSEVKKEDINKDCEEPITADQKQKVEVIVNQDTDVTITGVYSTHHHEGFCTVSGMQYRISSTSHTQTTATANCEKEGCSRDDDSRYTPLSALSSMQPPADHAHAHAHPVPELGGLTRRAAGCSSAFSAPSPAAHHEPDTPTLRPDDWLLEWPSEENTAQNSLDTQPGTSTDATPPEEPIVQDKNDLDTEILAILGDDPSCNDKYGPDIRNELASRLLHIAKEGLSKEDRKNLITKYLLPKNCAQLDAPKINLEIKAAINDIAVKRDKGIENKQKQMSSAIACLADIINSQLNSKLINNDMLQKLMDISRILCDLQHADSITRRNFILFALKNDMKEHLKNTRIDTLLFGEDLSDTLKSAKAVNKSGIELKADSSNRIANTSYKGPASRNLNRKAPPQARRPPAGPPRSRELATPRASYPQAPPAHYPPPPNYPPPPHAHSSKTSSRGHQTTYPRRRY